MGLNHLNWDLERLRQARVMVVGAGALGNEVLKNLALLGVGEVVVVDFDRVEAHNLNRSVLFRAADAEAGRLKVVAAAARLLELNPEMRVLGIAGDVMTDVGLGIFRRVDVVIGCVDNRLARLYVNRHSFAAGKCWVNGGILRLSGQVSVYRLDTNCYECELTPGDWEQIRHRMGCADIALRYAAQGSAPTTPVAASLIAAMQVEEAMKVIFGQWEASLVGRRFYRDGAFNVAKYFRSLPPKELCGSHFVVPEVLEAPLSAAHALDAVLSWLEEQFGAGADDLVQGESDADEGERGGQGNPGEVEGQVAILLEHPVVTKAIGLKSQVVVEMVAPQHRLRNDLIREWERIPGEGMGIPPDGFLDVLDRSFPEQDLSLWELGIPPLGILKVQVGEQRYYVELSGDQVFGAHLEQVRFQGVRGNSIFVL